MQMYTLDLYSCFIQKMYQKNVSESKDIINLIKKGKVFCDKPDGVDVFPLVHSV